MHDHIDFQMGDIIKRDRCCRRICGWYKTIDHLAEIASTPFLFSTSLTPGAAGACIKAIDLIEEHPEYVDTLWENANYFKDELNESVTISVNQKHQLLPVIVGDEKLAQSSLRNY
jgi:glycine C-acetyltransferase